VVQELRGGVRVQEQTLSIDSFLSQRKSFKSVSNKVVTLKLHAIDDTYYWIQFPSIDLRYKLYIKHIPQSIYGPFQKGTGEQYCTTYK